MAVAHSVPLQQPDPEVTAFAVIAGISAAVKEMLALMEGYRN